MSDTPAFFTRDGDRYVLTGVGVSPWKGRTIGGVPLAALITHLLDALLASGTMHTARITIDILGAVPMAPMESDVRVMRDGRNMQLLSGKLRSGRRTWVRASMLRDREKQTPPVQQPLTHALPHWDLPRHRNGFCEAIVAAPTPRVPGQGTRWVRFLPTLFPDTPLSPLVRAAMLADFGSGISGPLPLADWTFANVDITLSLTRLPRGDWMLVDASSDSAGNGVGSLMGGWAT